MVATRFAARLATLDLAARSAELLPGVEASLTARERGVNPPQAALALGGGAALRADHVGLRLGWSPATRLTAGRERTEPARSRPTASTLPVALPVIARRRRGDAAAPRPGTASRRWSGISAQLTGGLLGARGRRARLERRSRRSPAATRAPARALRLADFVADARAALAGWLPRLALSDLGRDALSLLADLCRRVSRLRPFARGFVEGTGHPDDPYRFALGAELPNVARVVPARRAGPRLFAAPEALREWRPGFDGLSPEALAAALAAEATVARDVRELIDGRDARSRPRSRWRSAGSAATAASCRRRSRRPGITRPHARRRRGAARLRSSTSRTRSAACRPRPCTSRSAPTHGRTHAGERASSTSSPPGLDAAMFAAPAAAATGDWFVRARHARRLPRGRRAPRTARPSRPRASRACSTRWPRCQQRHRARRRSPAPAMRRASRPRRRRRCTDLLLLGTPLAAISLTALATQPTADALRLLHRLLPPRPTPTSPTTPTSRSAARSSTR